MTVIARFCPYCGLGLEEQVGHEPWVVTILKCPACGYLHMTPKERRVFEMLGRGAYAREIAVALGAKGKTIEHHIRSLAYKMGVSNRQLMVKAIEQRVRNEINVEPDINR